MVDGWPGRPARTHGHASDSSSAAAAHAAQGADGIGMNAASYVLYMPLGDQTYHSVMSTYAFFAQRLRRRQRGAECAAVCRTLLQH